MLFKSTFAFLAATASFFSFAQQHDASLELSTLGKGDEHTPIIVNEHENSFTAAVDDGDNLDVHQEVRSSQV